MIKQFQRVVDNAANIKHGLEDLMNKLYIPYFSHVLNLVVKDVLVKENELSNEENHCVFIILKKCRKLVSLFKHSNKLSLRLVSCVELNNMKFDNPEDKCSINKLKQDVSTRWNSTFLML